MIEKWECMACRYIYDPAEGDLDNGVVAGTPFEELVENWVWPLCGVGKNQFEKIS